MLSEFVSANTRIMQVVWQRIPHPELALTYRNLLSSLLETVGLVPNRF